MPTTGSRRVAKRIGVARFLVTNRVQNWFSNMLPMDHPLVYQGMVFVTVEHFYQAMKLEKGDVAERRRIAELPSAYQAKRACNTKQLLAEGRLRHDWSRVKHEVMEFAVRHKFAAGTSWAKRLAREEGEIVEWNTFHDCYWGRCRCPKHGDHGSNHLGRLLMKIRDELRGGPASPPRPRPPGSRGPRGAHSGLSGFVERFGGVDVGELEGAAVPDDLRRAVLAASVRHEKR